MREGKSPRTWLVVLLTVIGTLVAERMVLGALVALSPSGPNVVARDLKDRLRTHFQSLDMGPVTGGVTTPTLGGVHEPLSFTYLYPVQPGPPQGTIDAAGPKPNDVVRLLNAIAETDRFMREQGFAPCPGSPLVIPGSSQTYLAPDRKMTLFSSNSGVVPPQSQLFDVTRPRVWESVTSGETMTVVLLRYRLRKVDEAECSIVFVLDRLQGRIGVGVSVDGQRNGRWGRADFATTSFGLQFLDDRRLVPILEMP